MIKANIYDKKLFIENFTVSDSVKFDTVKFTFPDSWNGYTKTAVFKTEGGKIFNVVLDMANPLCVNKNECYIPYEVIKSPCFYLSVFGVLGESVATTTQVRVPVLQSGYEDGDIPSEPTPTEYEQIINLVNDTKQIAQSVRDEADNGLFKGDKGDIGPQGPQGIQGDKGEKGDKGDKGEDAIIDQTFNSASTNAQSGTAVAEAMGNIADYKKSINRYNPSDNEGEFLTPALLVANGSADTSANRDNYFVTPYIKIEPNTTYTIMETTNSAFADVNRLRCYKEDKTPCEAITTTRNETNGTYTFTTNLDAKYIRISCVKKPIFATSVSAGLDRLIPSFNSQFMLVYGTQYPSEYTPYSGDYYQLTSKISPENLEDNLKELLTPLYKKTIVNFGDSIFGNARPPEDISTILANMTGATVYNCAFGGCRMSQHTGHWDAFSMYRLAYSIVNNDWTLQDEALNYYDRTSYAEEPLALLKSIDFNNVDIITINYGTNDWNANCPLENENDLFDTTTFLGALRYSVDLLQTKFPNLKIVFLSPTWRFWMTNGEYTTDSDISTSNGKTLSDWVEAEKAVVKGLHLTFNDMYNDLGINKYNRGIYFPANDGTHHNEKGRKLIAKYLSKKM